MNKAEYKVIGVMSGTSLDGVDIASIRFDLADDWSFQIDHAETIPYETKWMELLKDLVSISDKELQSIDIQYTDHLAQMIIDFIKKHHINDIDAICSHGHTARHQPENGITHQIGNLKQLAKLTGYRVVCDFRVQDVELGGQGAPLVPIGDRLLFNEYTFCLNLGGFANISMEENEQRVAFDICPVNIVLNHYSRQLGYSYDDKGQLASSGQLNNQLLVQLNNLEFYKLNPPKSLGLQWVQNEVFPMIDGFKLDVKDDLRTFTEHIAIQISDVVNSYSGGSLLITGGGAFNVFLISRLSALCNVRIEIPSKQIINYKEALVFGLLGILKLRDEPNCLQSVTGALKNHSSGKIYLP